MALLDLSAVTKVLIRLVQEEVAVSPVWDGSLPTVSPLPPDKLGDAGDLLGFYLYHLSEDPQFRNTPPPGLGPVPVALAPMGLVLHYQLTAHTIATQDAPDGAFKAQLLFGLAVKALHDNPAITDGTTVNGVELLAAYGLDGRDNRLRVTLRPVAVEDAVAYWMAGQGPARLAAYYQASVVLLEPKVPTGRDLLVLERGVGVVEAAPLVSGTHNVLAYEAPGVGQRSLRVSPAQVPIGGRFSVLGTGLVGEGTDLVLEGPRDWTEQQVVDPLTWAVVVTPSELTATVGGSAGTEPVVPGVYAVMVRVRRGPAVFTSNRTAIVVTPSVSDPGTAPIGGTVVLTGARFVHPSIPVDPDDEHAVQVLVGDARLALDRDGVLAAGEYQVTDAETLTVRLPADIGPGFWPVRVRVNGAEGPPRWVEVTG